MKKQEYLNQLKEDWNNIDEIIPYGFGWEANRCIDKLIEDFKIPFIIDNSIQKIGSEYRGIKIISWEQAKNKIDSRKILITTRYRQYSKISDSLKQENFCENRDFAWVKEFIPEWYWRSKGQCNLYTVDFTVSPQCNFKCKNCNMFMPYYHHPIKYSFDYFKENLDLFFKVVDYVCYIGFIGGEPFLCDCLEEIINYAVEMYSDKIGNYTIHSNGSITPSESLISVIKKNNITVAISDYGAESPSREKMLHTIEVLRREGIYCDVRADLEWRDVGFPQEPQNFSDENIEKHMQACSADWRGLDDGKFYYCNIAWSAEKAGLTELESGDYLILKDLINQGKNGKYELLLHSMGYFPKGYMSFCKKCGGCGQDNTKLVTPGVQY